jgi:hypothetical protein
VATLDGGRDLLGQHRTPHRYGWYAAALLAGLFLAIGPVVDFVWDLATEEPSAGEFVLRFAGLLLALVFAWWIVVGSLRRARR